MNGSNQMADQIKPQVTILHELGAGKSWFDPLAFARVTTARFGNAGFDSLYGPGYANLDLSFFRQFAVHGSNTLQFRVEIFNVTNTPHFANPASNVSNLQLNADGTVRSVGGFSPASRARRTRNAKASTSDWCASDCGSGSRRDTEPAVVMADARAAARRASAISMYRRRCWPMISNR